MMQPLLGVGTEGLCYYCVVLCFSLQITNIGLIYLGAAVLGAYVFMIVVSSWWVEGLGWILLFRFLGTRVSLPGHPPPSEPSPDYIPLTKAPILCCLITTTPLLAGLGRFKLAFLGKFLWFQDHTALPTTSPTLFLHHFSPWIPF